MKELLHLNNVSVKNENKYRLKGIHLSINAGEKIALLGENGAGKSTLISVANGAIEPDVGHVNWKGVLLKYLSNRQQHTIGTIWQDLRLVEELSVGQNINIGALGRHNLLWALTNLLTIINKDECLRCLEAAGLELKLLTAPVTKLSGGQRQRVAIARLLRQQAELLLADEPFSSLDPNRINEVLNLLLQKRTIKSINIPSTCLISLHRPDLIKHFTRVIGLKAGEIILDSQTKELPHFKINSLFKDR